MKPSSVEMKKKMLRALLLIRRFEEKAVDIYKAGEFTGYLHPCIGQEAVAVGACSALKKEDYIISNHRGHGHCIARGADISKMMAELLGKATGYNRGRGGSMNISDPDIKLMAANGIVGGGIPMAVGAGLGCKMRKKKEVVLCFFGDGASNNGVFHEALNMAALFDLPVIFLCENNLYAISTCSLDSVSCTDIGKRACAYGIPGPIIDGSDVLEVLATVEEAADRARGGRGPTLIEAKTYRFYGHHPGDPAEYRPQEEVMFYREQKDPLENFKNKLLDGGVVCASELDEMERDVAREISDSLEFARNSPQPDVKEFVKETFGM